jgi:hypothetical protein
MAGRGLGARRVRASRRVTGMRTTVTAMRTRIRIAWVCGGRRQRVLVGVGAIVASVLTGAFLFGAWHVLFGGFVKGNWRAGGFGVVLAAVSSILLWIEAAVVRRR